MTPTQALQAIALGNTDPDEMVRIAKEALEQPALQVPSGFPCKIIEADFEANTVLLEMQGRFLVSAGQKMLCDAAAAPAAPEYPPLPAGEPSNIVYRWRALDNSGFCYGSNSPDDLPQSACLTAFYRQPGHLRAALHEISATGNLTATPEQFARHLQKIARDALAGEAVEQPAGEYPPLPAAVAHTLGLAKYAHSSNIFAAHEFTPDTEHADEWEALHTADQMLAFADATVALRASQPVSGGDELPANVPALDCTGSNDMAFLAGLASQFPAGPVKKRLIAITNPAAPQGETSYQQKFLDLLADVLDAKEAMLASGCKQADFPTMFAQFHALAAQGQEAEPAVPRPPVGGECRAQFEVWARQYGTWEVQRDDQPNMVESYTDLNLTIAWHAWQAALVAAPQAPVAWVKSELIKDGALLPTSCTAHKVQRPGYFALYAGHPPRAQADAPVGEFRDWWLGLPIDLREGYAQGGVHPCEVAFKAGATLADADKRDAERYRWLRNPDQDVSLVLDKVVGVTPADENFPGIGGYRRYEYRAGEELDAAIDAALKKGGAA